MSAEYTRQQAVRTAAAFAAYAGACAAVRHAKAECHELQGAPAEVRLDARQRLEKARQAQAMARSGVVQAAWADGSLSHAPVLGAAVGEMLAGVNSPGKASMDTFPSRASTIAFANESNDN
jgi:hypothetical protein